VKRSHAIGLAALLVLLLGLWAARGSFGPRDREAGPDEPGDDVVARAMSQAPPVVDSTAIKMRWHDEVRGIEIDALNPEQHELFVRHANAGLCSCGFTLAGCKANDMTCEECGARLTALRDSILAGQLKTAKGIRARPEHGS
jgi:hypothetical protein